MTDRTSSTTIDTSPPPSDVLRTVGAVRLTPRAPDDRLDELQVLRGLARSLQSRLDAEIEQRRQAERAASEQRHALTRARRSMHDLIHHGQQIQDELVALETPVAPHDDSRLLGYTILYVGARPERDLQRQLLVLEQGGSFESFHGDIPSRPAALLARIRAADVVFAASDELDADRLRVLRQLCRSHGKPCVALRSGGPGSLMLALRHLDSR